jgi:hypothetical protein
VSGARVTWHELRPLTAALFGCDFPDCGEQADTIHLVPWCDRECEQVLFACPRHDAGGYCIEVESYLEEWIDWKQHLAEKIDPARCDCDHPGGLWLLLARLEQLTYPLVHVAEPDETPALEQPPAASAKPPRRARRQQPAPLERGLAAGELTRYGRAALAGLLDEMRTAAEHTRNNTLNKLAFRAGQLVGAGQIAEDVAQAELERAAIETGLPAREARATTLRALADGRKQPARIEEPR